MKTYTKKLELCTSYEKTGNSDDSQISALSIALTGDDYNDLLDWNIDYIFDCEYNAKKYAIENHAETLFTETLTAEQLKQYAEDLSAYNNALQEYTDGLMDMDRWDLPQVIAQDIEKDMDSVHDDLYRDWIHGDYRNFDGVIPQANKKLAEYGETYDYVRVKGGEPYITLSFSDEDIKSAYDDGMIEKKTAKAFVEWHEMRIDNMGDGKYQEKKRKREAQKAERERLTAYKKAQKEAQDNRKREELKAKAKNK